MPTHSSKTILVAPDQQNSVLNALDTNGLHPVVYTPYGHRPLNGLLSLLGFNGELMDLLTGRYHLGNGYRPFSPVLMRFICPDNLSPFGKGGMNAYVYCGGDPRNQVDPSGHFTVSALIKSLKSSAATHHSGINKIKDLTKNAIYKTADSLGGSSRVETLAKQKGKMAETYLLDEVITRRATKTKETLEHASNSIQNGTEFLKHYNKLIKAKSIYMDILVGTKDSAFRPANLKKIHNELVNETNTIIRKFNDTKKHSPINFWVEISS